MPGIHLNDTEKKLKHLWESNTAIPYVTKIEIHNSTPIRGLKGCIVEFKYPITVFCGKNGSGKSTLMQLSALAFHNKDRHFRKTFSDFFKKTKYDSDNTGTSLTWYYSGKDKSNKTISPIKITKGIKKWMHYDRRPDKKVIILPVSRTLPANERMFTKADILSDKSFILLNDKYIGYLKQIMGRNYCKVGEHLGLFSKCQIDEHIKYSSYNMGIGEKILCYILAELQEADKGSLIAIDEIEMGLHPEALSILAQILQEITLEKQLQIFITSHSRDFLDALPREARIVVDKVGENLHIINNPTTIYAISRISQKTLDELVIICEDITAQCLIQTILGKSRNRVSFAIIGSKSELLKAAKYQKELGDARKCLIIWDGDVSDTDISKYHRTNELEENSIPYIKLPGGEDIAPEKWIINALNCDEGYDALASYFNIDRDEAKRYIEKALAQTDCHNIFYTIKEECGMEESHIMLLLCNSVLKIKSEELQYIKDKVDEILNH